MIGEYKNRVSWIDITRRGKPEFEVMRRPIFSAGEILEVGALFPTEGISKTRLRQLYQTNKIKAAENVQPVPVVPKPSKKKGKQNGNAEI